MVSHRPQWLEAGQPVPGGGRQGVPNGRPAARTVEPAQDAASSPRTVDHGRSLRDRPGISRSAPTAPSTGAAGNGDQDPSQGILEATKQVARLLRASGRRFALAGSVAAYAHGVPRRTLHDTDFCVLRDEIDAVSEVLTRSGLHVWSPPEDWLVKTEFQGRPVDLIFFLSDRPVSADLLERAAARPVDSVWMPVLAPTDLLVSQLTAFSEHHCDFGRVLLLGSYLLAEAIDGGRADLAVHGHAHAGTEHGMTAGGVPVRNVAQPVVRHAFALYELHPAGTAGC
ncbi:putative nucleotidyltransferase-like protein [Streptomyces sp. TLI_235]|nr:putative nucleotidyltransferase-like protein [Streptomyces sp. TLI_235]